MSDSIRVANAGRSDLTLPCGTIVPAGQTVPVAVERLREHVAHPVVRHWFEERVLRADGPLPLATPADAGDGEDLAAKLVEAEEKLALATDRLQAVNVDLEVERAARRAAQDEVARLTELLVAAKAAHDAERKAREEAETNATLVADELAETKAALEQARAGKPKGAR